MNQPLISVLHPTRRVSPSEAFPSGWQAAFRKWISAADDPSRIEYVIAVHTSRWSEFWGHAEFFDVPVHEWYGAGVSLLPEVVRVTGHDLAGLIVVRNSGRDCAVDQINCAAAASSGLLLTGAQDDLFPPEHWDTLALQALPWFVQRPGDLLPAQRALLTDAEKRGEYVIRCSSGSPRDHELTIAGFMSRARYEQLGYCLHPMFDGMFADDYFDFELRRDEKLGLVTVLERQDIQFEHRHPIFGKGQTDEAYDQQNARENYQQGFATFRRLTDGCRVLAVCLPGEVFRHEWVASWFNILMYANNSGRFIVSNHWCHTTNVYSTRIELADSVLTAAPKADLVLWADDDNTLEPAQFDLLVKALDENPDLDIVVGHCWCDPGPEELHKDLMMSCGRQGGWTGNEETAPGSGLLCKRFKLDDFKAAVASGKMLITSDDIAPDAFWSGFPVVLMRYSALEKIGWRAFLPMVREDVKHSFTSEDTSFFYNAHRAGLKSAVHLSVQVPHLKVRSIFPQYIPGGEWEKAEQAKGKGLTFAVEEMPPAHEMAEVISDLLKDPRCDGYDGLTVSIGKRK